MFEVSLLCEHYLVDVDDIVVTGLYPSQVLVALGELLLDPLGIAALPDLTNLYPFYLYPVFTVESAQNTATHSLCLELAVEESNAIGQR